MRMPCVSLTVLWVFLGLRSVCWMFNVSVRSLKCGCIGPLLVWCVQDVWCSWRGPPPFSSSSLHLVSLPLLFPFLAPSILPCCVCSDAVRRRHERAAGATVTLWLLPAPSRLCLRCWRGAFRVTLRAGIKLWTRRQDLNFTLQAKARNQAWFYGTKKWNLWYETEFCLQPTSWLLSIHQSQSEKNWQGRGLTV